MTNVKSKLLVSASVLSISLAGIAFIQSEEGTEYEAYLDSVAVPTICTGSTRNVFIPMKATPAECEQRLVEDTSYAGKAVGRLVAVKLTQGQYDALVSFVFNVGPGAFGKSTMLRYINTGKCQEAGAQFNRWVYAGGKKLRGLVKRRGREAAKWLEDCDAWT